MDIGNALKSAAKAVKGSIVQEFETYVMPVKLQQLYKGYKLRDTTLGRLGMPTDFLVTLAQLADHVYLTGTKAAHSREDSPFAISLRAQLGELFQNYMQIQRFDAATGLAFETRGPFGAVVASAVPPGLERVPIIGRVHPGQARYRLFIVFRGTVNAFGDLYADVTSRPTLETAAPKLANSVARTGWSEVALGLPQHLRVLPLPGHRAVPAPRSGLPARRIPQARRGGQGKGSAAREASGPAGGQSLHHLPVDRMELYVVGHSLGGAVATLCAYDLRLRRFPPLQPRSLGHLRQPAGGEHPGFSPSTSARSWSTATRTIIRGPRYLRSIRVVARAADGNLDYISAPPVAPAETSSTSIQAACWSPAPVDSRWGAHGPMRDSYIPALDAEGEVGAAGWQATSR